MVESHRWILHSRRVLCSSSAELEEAWIEVDLSTGRIQAIHRGAVPSWIEDGDCEVLDVGDKVVMPAIVDAHVCSHLESL